MSPELFQGFRPDQIAALFGLDVDGDAFQSLGFSTADFEFKNDGILQLAADHSSHSATVSVPQTEDVRPIYRLGSNPVDKEGFTPEQLRNPDTNPDLQENLNKAADALAESDTSMPPEKVNAIKSAMTDPNGWEEKRAGDLKDKKVLMAHGDKHGEFGAEERILKLDPDTVVYEKTIRYTVDGVTYEEKLYMPKDCANLSIDATADTPTETKPAAQPAPVIEDHCPEDGQMFDAMGNGVYRADEQVAYTCTNGETKMVDVSVVIADSPSEAKQMGWREARATDGYVQMFYRDESGCLHFVGCYPPDAEDLTRGSRVLGAPEPRLGNLWDKETRDENGNLLFDVNGNGVKDAGDRVLPLKKGPEGTRMIEWEFRSQGITKFSKVS